MRLCWYQSSRGGEDDEGGRIGASRHDGARTARWRRCRWTRVERDDGKVCRARRWQSVLRRAIDRCNSRRDDQDEDRVDDREKDQRSDRYRVDSIKRYEYDGRATMEEMSMFARDDVLNGSQFLNCFISRDGGVNRSIEDRLDRQRK